MVVKIEARIFFMEATDGAPTSPSTTQSIAQVP
jgi:hypothetical protein